jgi:hypothetical protein
MTDDDLEAALIEAIEREYTAGLSGAVALQAVAMDEIRALRILARQRS